MSGTTAAVPSVLTTADVVVSAIFPLLSLLSIILRFKARRTGSLKVLADDWWILISWVITFALSLTTWIFVGLSGVGHLKGPDIVHSSILSTQCLWIEAILLQVCLGTIKISILYFYKRIFPITRFIVVANIGIVIIAIWVITYLFLIIFQFNPVSGSWTGEGHNVINSTKLDLSQAGTSIAIDVLVLCFPLPMILRLHMQPKRKFAVMMIFWLGGFCCIAAIVRLILLHQGEAAASSSASDSGFTAITLISKAVIFITIEPNCSIIAACLPCYGPLIEGGRMLESIVNSIRSALSLRSISSATRIPDVDKSNPANLSLDDGGESQIELQSVSRGWEQQPGQSSASAERNVDDLYSNHPEQQGIEITQSYKIRSDFKNQV